MLLHAYWNRPARLLLWSGVSFVGLTCNNLLLFADLVLFPDVNLALYRSLAAAAAIMLLLAALIWDSK